MTIQQTKISPATARDSPHSAKLGQNQPSESSPLLPARIGPAALLSTKSRRSGHSPNRSLDHSAHKGCLETLCCQRRRHESLMQTSHTTEQEYEDTNMNIVLFHINLRSDAADSQNTVLRIDKTTWRRSKLLHEAIPSRRLRGHVGHICNSSRSLYEVTCKENRYLKHKKYLRSFLVGKRKKIV